MKKFFSMMVAMATLFSFAACEDNPEPTPEPGKKTKLENPVLAIAEQTATSVTISWEAVANAANYSVVLGTDISTTDKTSVTFNDLSIGKHTISVKALAAKDSKWSDSDYVSIEVNIAGETEADWFTQELFLSNDYADQGLYDYNSIFYSWEGIGVTGLKFGYFATATAEDMSNDEILAELQTVNDTEVFDYINTTGYVGALTGLPAATDVTVVVYVTNEEGKSVLCRDNIVTAEAVVPEIYKPWIGTYSVTASHKYQFNEDGTSAQVAEPETFTVIMSYDSTNDGIYLDGFSVLGSDYPTLALINEEGGLDIWSGLSIGTNAEGMSYVWMVVGEKYAQGSETSTGYGFYNNQIPSYSLTNVDGAISCAPYSYDLTEGGTEYMNVVATDIFGLQGQQLYFLIEAWPASFRSGEFTFTKTSDTVEAPQTMSCGVRSALPAPIAASVVLN